MLVFYSFENCNKVFPKYLLSSRLFSLTSYEKEEKQNRRLEITFALFKFDFGYRVEMFVFLANVGRGKFLRKNLFCNVVNLLHR